MPKKKVAKVVKNKSAEPKVMITKAAVTPRVNRAETPDLKAVPIQVDLNKAFQVNGKKDGTGNVFDMLKSREFPYTVATLEEYRKQLNALDLSSLQHHAIETANILPNITDRARLVDKLEVEFLRRQGVFMARYATLQNRTVS